MQCQDVLLSGPTVRPPGVMQDIVVASSCEAEEPARSLCRRRLLPRAEGGEGGSSAPRPRLEALLEQTASETSPSSSESGERHSSRRTSLQGKAVVVDTSVRTRSRKALQAMVRPGKLQQQPQIQQSL